MLEELLRPLCFITFHGDDFLTPSLLQSFTQACATDERSGVTKLINPEPYLYLNTRTFFLSFSFSLSARAPLCHVTLLFLSRGVQRIRRGKCNSTR